MERIGWEYPVTWVNTLTVRVMNTGCDKHLIALVL